MLKFCIFLLFAFRLFAETDGDLENRLRQFIRFDPAGANTIGYLYVGGHETSIDDSAVLRINRGLDYYKKHRPVFIILKIDSPGGEVFAAQKISDALKQIDIQSNIPVVAFIDNWAISAGAMLAYSCRFIAVVKDASMGAAEPVTLGQSGSLESVSEKITSAFRSDFGSRARFFDRNPLIAEAMVDKDLILVERNGEIVRLESENQIRFDPPDPDRVISRKGKLLTLNAEEMIRYGVADLLLPPVKLIPVTSSERQQGSWPAEKMLLFHAPFFSDIPRATIDAYRPDWQTQFFIFLALPVVSSLLLAGFLIGGYIELNHPGLSFPGFIAAGCLLLMIVSGLYSETAGGFELILLSSGILLVLLELFVFPTGGILAIVGAVVALVGLFGMFLPDMGSIRFDGETGEVNPAGATFFERLGRLSGTLIASVIAAVMIGRYLLPKYSKRNPFVLSGNEQEFSEGYFAGADPSKMPPIGTEGVVFAPLRPTGKVILEKEIYDAVSAGDYIEKGERIIVTRVEEGAIFVDREMKEKK